MGKPHHKPTEKTRKLVGDMAIDGRSQEEIAKRLHISIDTLTKHYDYEVRHYKHDVTYQIQDILIKNALAGKRWAVDKYLSCRADWAPYKRPDEVLTNGKQYVLLQYQERVIVDDSNKSNDTRSTDLCIPVLHN